MAEEEYPPTKITDESLNLDFEKIQNLCDEGHSHRDIIIERKEMNKKKENEKPLHSLIATFPVGTVPLFFAPKMTNFSSQIYVFDIHVTGNGAWICGVVPESEVQSYEQYNCPITIGKVPVGLRSNGFYVGGRGCGKYPAYSLHNNKIRVVFDLDQGKVSFFFGESHKTFDLTHPDYNKGFRFCVSGCADTLLNAKGWNNEAGGRTIKPARRS